MSPCRLRRARWLAVMVAALNACVDTSPPLSATRGDEPVVGSSGVAGDYGFLLLNDRGDTIAVERVRRGATWLDAQRWLPRSGEMSRHVLQYAAPRDLARWDVTRQRGRLPGSTSEPDGWRVYVTADSLFVAQGAVIGSRFSFRSLAAPQSAMPWHDASGALFEAMLHRTGGAPASRVVSGAYAAAVQASDIVHAVTIESLRGDSLLLRHPDAEWRLALDHRGELLGGINTRARLRLYRVPCPPDSLFNGSPRAATVADSARYSAAEVVLRASDGVLLAGTFTKPRGARRAPAVLFVSGAGPQDRNLSVPGLPDYRLFAALADTLAQRGIAVLRLDDRGTGRSGGVAYSATASEEIDDVRMALGWLRARTDVNADRIALLGHSDGGLTVLHTAEAGVDRSGVPVRDESTDLRALVVIGAPSRSGREIARLQRRLFVTADSSRFPLAQREQTLGLLDAATERVARVDPWLRSWLAHDPRTATWRSSVPVLLVHGERDQQVPVAQARELAALLRRGNARDVRTALLPAVNHLLVTDADGDPRRYRALPSRAISSRALGPIVEWLATRLE